MRDGTTSEDSATQLLICEPLSFAMWKFVEEEEELHNSVVNNQQSQQGNHFQ